MVASQQGSRIVPAMVAARGRRYPQPGRHKPPGIARAVAGPPFLSPGDRTLPLAPLLFSHGANGLPLEASAPPPLSQGAALSLLAGPRAGDTGRKRSAHSRPNGAPGETLPGGASVLVIGPRNGNKNTHINSQ